MSSYRQILYHIIFRTKESQRTLSLVHNKELFMYIHGIIKYKKCTLYRINTMEDYLHLLSDMLHSRMLIEIKILFNRFAAERGGVVSFPPTSSGVIVVEAFQASLILYLLKIVKVSGKKNWFAGGFIILIWLILIIVLIKVFYGIYLDYSAENH
jgi:hypothetical protein